VTTVSIIDLLRLSQSPDRFFLEAHPKLRPVDTASDGVFLAGCCQGPKDIPDTVAQAKGAAASALIPLARGKVAIDAQVAEVIEDTCRGCGFCVSICPYTAIELVTINRMGHFGRGWPGSMKHSVKAAVPARPVACLILFSRGPSGTGRFYHKLRHWGGLDERAI